MGIRQELGKRILGASEFEKLEASMEIMREAYFGGPYQVTPSLLHARLTEIDAQLIDLFVDQLGYEIIGGGLAGFGQDTEKERLRSIEEARRLFKYDVITQWGVWTWTNYGFGEDIRVTPENSKAAKDFKEFWLADRNSAILGASELASLSNDCLVDGEIFLVYFVGVDGKSTVRTISTEEIVDIVTDPEDASTKLFYKRRWQERGDWTEAYYPDWRAFYSEEEQSPLEQAVLDKDLSRFDQVSENNTYAVIQHVPHNLKRPRERTNTSLALRGWPISTSSAPWSRAHKAFREDRATVAAAVAMYVNKIKHGQGSRATDAIRDRLASALQTNANVRYETNPAAAAGSTWIENEAMEMSRMPLTTGAGDAEIDGSALFLMANLGLGLFPHYAGAGDAYRLATATAMERPLEMQWSRYQLFWSSQFKTMARIVLLAYEHADKGAKSYTSYAATVSTDRLVEIDLALLSKSLTELFQGTIIPLLTLGAIPTETAAMIAAGIWRIALQAVGVVDPDDVASDDAFTPEEEEEDDTPAPAPPVVPDDDAEPEEEPEEGPAEETIAIALEVLALLETHTPEEVFRHCPLEDCDGDKALKYNGHKGVLLCAKCSRSFDPEVE